MPSLGRERTPVLERATRERLVVLTQAASPPAWAMAWCERGGRPLTTRNLTVHCSHGAPSGLLRAITDLGGRHVLLTRAAEAAAPRRVAVALGGLPRDAAVLTEAAACAGSLEVPLDLVHGVPLAFAERSVGLDQALERGEWLLEAATRQVAAHPPDLRVTTRLVRARAHELVTEVPEDELLVLGMAHHPTRPEPHLAGMSAIHFAPGPILFVPT